MKSKAAVVVSKGMGVEHAYRVIRGEIVSLTLRPGSPLDELALATRLGLSRTPVHEALVRLAAESLVVLSPNRGGSVAGMEWDQIREFLEAFDLQQRVVTRWAALRRTDDQLAALDTERRLFERHERAQNTEEMNESNWRFHALIAAASGNRLMERSYLHLLTLSLRIAYLAYEPNCFVSPEAYRTHMDAILREHVEMVGAIKAGDCDRAEALGRSHAHLARDRIMDTLARGASGALDICIDP